MFGLEQEFNINMHVKRMNEWMNDCMYNTIKSRVTQVKIDTEGLEIWILGLILSQEITFETWPQKSSNLL